MYGRCTRPIFVYVVAHLLHEFWDQMGFGRPMLTVAYFNRARTKIAGKQANSS